MEQEEILEVYITVQSYSSPKSAETPLKVAPIPHRGRPRTNCPRIKVFEAVVTRIEMFTGD